jgi:hypothetical protein
MRYLAQNQVVSKIGITEFELPKSEAAITLTTTPRHPEA